MEKVQAEKILGILYCLSVISSLISVISLVITWQYWAWTLDVCININCSCILYGINTFSAFMGGGVKLCHFGAFGLIPIILIGLCLTIYHGYHSYISRNFEERRSLPSIKNYQTRNSLEGRIMVDGPTPRGPCKHWMIVAFVIVLICCLSLAHAVVLTDGYYKTCNQYRRNLVRLLGSRGQELQAIHNRLACSAILDFMDYIQPDANNWRRGDQINTAVALQLSIFMSWINFFSWFFIFFVNINISRQ